MIDIISGGRFAARDALYPPARSTLSLYTNYLEQIEKRRDHGLHPKPIEDAALVEELISQIQEPEHEHRADSLQFFIYNLSLIHI